MKSVWRLFMQKIQDRRKKVEEYKYRPARTSGRCSRAGVSGYDRPFGDQIQHGPFHLRQHLPVCLGIAGIPYFHGGTGHLKEAGGEGRGDAPDLHPPCECRRGEEDHQQCRQ